MRRPSAAAMLSAFLAGAGVLHFARPRPYESIVPPQLPSPRAIVYASGVAEIACAAAVAVPRTRRRGALASATLFVAVFPANVQMALDSRRDSAPLRRAVAWGRLPLQVPLVGWALHVARAVD